MSYEWPREHAAMEFGLQVSSFAFGDGQSETFERTLALATAAEDGGAHSFWVMDHPMQICRAMFTASPSTFEGRHFRTRDVHNVPPPYQPGGPSILVGGGGERRTLALVARHADICNLVGDLETVVRKIDVLHRHCEAV